MPEYMMWSQLSNCFERLDCRKQLMLNFSPMKKSQSKMVTVLLNFFLCIWLQREVKHCWLSALESVSEETGEAYWSATFFLIDVPYAMQSIFLIFFIQLCFNFNKFPLQKVSHNICKCRGITLWLPTNIVSVDVCVWPKVRCGRTSGTGKDATV